MLNHTLLHPEINAVLGRAGHGATVLIADGNYPASTTLGPHGVQVSLNLSPGRLTCPEVLEALLTAIPIERANTMMYETTGPYALKGDPPAWKAYRGIFRRAKVDLALEPIERFAFYDAVATPKHVLTIQTAELQRYANLLLTIGVRS